MPSRILKESICTSENLATISAEAEVLFYRLIVKADDFGLYHGNPKIIASLLFPLSVPTERKVASWLSELCKAGLVATYTAAEDGKKYLKLLSWDKHQNRRAQKSKFPLPCSLDSICTQQETGEDFDTCAQMQADSSVNVNENENVNEERKRVTAQNGAGGRDGFDRFWSAYPRKVGKKDAVKVWNQIKPDDNLIDQIVQGVERWKRSEQWTKDEGRFIPYGEGEWGELGGLILTNFEVHDFPTAKTNFDAFYYGQDFGYNHADAILGVGSRYGEIYICSEIYVFEKDTEEIINLAKQNKVDQRVEMFCDSAEPDRIKTWQKAGFRTAAVKKEPGSVKAQIDWLKGRKIHIHPSCVNVLKEVQQWKWKKDATSGLYIDEPVEFMDDAMAALRYAVERLRRGSAIEVER